MWGVLLVASGLWTLFNAYIAFQLLFHQPNTMDAGFAAIGWDFFLVISIPVYILFIALLFNFPKKSGPPSQPLADKDSSKDW